MEQNKDCSWDIFVSHNRMQKPWVRSLVRQWRKRGLRVFFDEDSISPGEDIVTGIERGVQGSKYVVIVISPDAMSSNWVALETAISVYMDPSGLSNKIIPILIETTPLENIRPAIKRLSIVDLTNDSTRREQYCKLFEFFGVAPAPRIPKIKAPVRVNQPIKKNRQVQKQATDEINAFSPFVLETGAMLADSPFYIERQSDGRASAQLVSHEPTVTIRGYRKSGKSSLLNRLHHSASVCGLPCCYLDFQGIGATLIQNTEHFFKQVAHMIAKELSLKQNPEEAWNSRLSPEINLTRFIENCILRVSQKPVQLLFDEVDLLLKTPVGVAFFSILRHWHNLRATDHTGVWKRLRFAIAHASDPAVWIPPTTQSPFNVGLPLELEDLTLDQITDLNCRLGSPLKSKSQIRVLFNLTSGHPYLVRRALHALVSSKLSFSLFLKSASLKNGPLGSHLMLYFNQVMEDAELLSSLEKIVREGICQNKYQFDQLWATGLITSHKPNVVRLRCKLYEDFFRGIFE